MLVTIDFGYVGQQILIQNEAERLSHSTSFTDYTIDTNPKIRIKKRVPVCGECSVIRSIT